MTVGWMHDHGARLLEPAVDETQSLREPERRLEDPSLGAEAKKGEKHGRGWGSVGWRSDLAWAHSRDHSRSMAQREIRSGQQLMSLYKIPSAGRTDNEVWFFAEGAGSHRWLQVVVHYEGGEGWVVTAFTRGSLPRR